MYPKNHNSSSRLGCELVERTLSISVGLTTKPKFWSLVTSVGIPSSAWEFGGVIIVLKDQIKANMDDKVVENHIEHQQKFLQLSKDNLTLVQNRMK